MNFCMSIDKSIILQLPLSNSENKLNPSNKVCLLAAVVIGLVSGCGGGDSNVAAPAAGSGGTISGSVSKGPVNSATVCVYKIDNAAAGRKGAQIVATGPAGATIISGCVVTQADGSYTLILPPDTSGDVIIETSGGTYCSNEAQYDKVSLTCQGAAGIPVALGTNALRTVVAAPVSGTITSVAVTPFSTASFANAITAGALSFASYQTQFNALVTAVGLPSTITTGTLVSNADLQAALAAISKSFGTLPSNYTQTIADLALARLLYSGGGFNLAPVANSGVLPTFDVTKCPVVIDGGAIKGYSSCGAGAVSNFSKTLVLSALNTSCNLTIASGVFTLTNGTSTVVAAWSGDTAGDDLTTLNGAPSSLTATTTAPNGDAMTALINFGTGKIDSSSGVISPKVGANTQFTCVNG